MPSTETSPEPGLPAEGTSHPPAMDAPPPDLDRRDGNAGVVQLIRDLAEDTRTLVEQEIELVRLETGASIKRVAVDAGWIWAGGVVLTVGGICLALALALGIGALLDSYWLGALITGSVFLVLGGVLAWRGIRDLRAGGLLPGGTLASLRKSRDWAQSELDELKKGLTEET